MLWVHYKLSLVGEDTHQGTTKLAFITTQKKIKQRYPRAYKSRHSAGF
jgi:hypothetical protein